MKLHDLAPKITKKAKMRKGQGNGSKGTFSGRGCNGQNSRAGGGVRLGFEGGQSGILAHMPKKRGFNNPKRIESQVLNINKLNENFKEGEIVNLESLVKLKLINKNNSKVKILGEGGVDKKLEIGAELLISVSAKKAIEKAGGRVLIK
jgi:large subunit ribosomal protein L15